MTISTKHSALDLIAFMNADLSSCRKRLIELRVIVLNLEEQNQVHRYSTFSLDPETKAYKLTSAPDTLEEYKGMIDVLREHKSLLESAEKSYNNALHVFTTTCQFYKDMREQALNPEE
jgi:hypothetical protein